MPSSRPKIVIYSDDETIQRLDKIAEKQKRSRANLCELIISEYLDNYEASQNQELLKSQTLENKHMIS